eukprot:583896-Prymnesium_polylepis.2
MSSCGDAAAAAVQARPLRRRGELTAARGAADLRSSELTARSVQRARCGQRRHSALKRVHRT